MNNLITQLIQKQALKEASSILQLQNKDRITVGAIYLDNTLVDNIIIYDTHNEMTEKYYIYIPSQLGHISIFFTYWKFIEQSAVQN